MEISFLGTGSIIPDPDFKVKRSYSSILIEINKEKLLFDIGPGTLTKMQSKKINTQLYPDYLFLTHFHIDHVLDYIALVKSRHFDQKTGGIKKGKKLNVYGPIGLKKWNKNIFENIFHWSYMNKELNYNDIVNLNEKNNGMVIENKNWKVTCCPVEHDNSIAFRIDHDGKSFVYSGDMAYDERICILGRDADLVAIECSFPNNKSLKGKHLEPTRIANLAKKGNFKKLILTHLYPSVNGKEDIIVKSIKKIVNCEVTIAYDFKKIKL